MKFLTRSIAIRVLTLTGAACAAELAEADGIPETAKPAHLVNTTAEPMAPGKFQPTWDSLRQYQVPDWFRDAKFGIWAHWGPQCQPEQGDWYARFMYQEGSSTYKYQVAHYGHPSVFGFKDVIHTWKAEHWDPDKLVTLYKRVGARYFFALGNHHDNFDLWDSKYQPWNAVKVGPQKDLVAGWARAAHDQGLPFGVSIHAAHAWSWYEMTQGADKEGPKAGVPYDGKLTKADGEGKWWEGLDPQDLYEQKHTPSPDFMNQAAIFSRWMWGAGVSQPDQAYCQKFYNRTADLINRYHPDMLYFDDTALPLWPVSDAGLKIAADFYNASLARSGGKTDGIIFGKGLTDSQQKALVYDIERGVANAILPTPWQTDTCIGGWHYDRKLYDRNGYKTGKAVVQMLADIVSKNGNLLLNVPLRGDGAPDEKELKVLDDIRAWMDVNGEAIYGTRPWVVFGEGPASEAPPPSGGGFGENKAKPFTAQDVRFTTKGNVLYAFLMDWPGEQGVHIKALAQKSPHLTPGQKISGMTLLGGNDRLEWTQDAEGLHVKLPATAPCSGPVALKIVLNSVR